MHPDPQIVVHGDPLPPTLIEMLTGRGLRPLEPRRRSDIPDLDSISAFIAHIKTEVMQGDLEPRACRRRMRSVFTDLEPINARARTLVLLVHGDDCAPAAMDRVVRSEMNRYIKRVRKSHRVDHRVSAIIISESPRLPDLTELISIRLQERIEPNGSVEFAPSYKG